MIRSALERDRAGNFTEALGGVSHSERLEIENFADSIAAKYGSATNTLKALNEMLKAGFSVPGAKGSIASILEGSIVGDMPAAEVAGAVSKIVTQYGLSMRTVEDASASSRRIADNLAYGANATSASMKDMMEAYKFVGSAASAAGESIESTNALIIALNKAGQLGPEAGVALRSAYVRLLKPTKEGRAAMARLGLDYGDYVSGGKRTGAGVAAGLSANGFDMAGSEKDIDAALASNEGNTEKQRKAIYDAVVAKFGSEAAKDRESVLQAVDAAFTMAGSKVDLTKLLIDLKKKGATQGDLARIFEGRQSVRMLSLLKADLEGILNDINTNAPGYSAKTFDIANQGLSKAVRELDAAWQSLGNTLVRAVLPEITTLFKSVSEGLKSLAQSNPAVLRLGIGLATAAAAAGPLALALGAVGRVGAFALTALLTPVGLVARGFVMLGGVIAGVATAAVGRLAAMALGFHMLTALGAAATLSALGGSLLALGRSILLFPLAAMRAIGVAMWALVANPVGLIITALVVALTALSVWVYNNWAGIKEFFAGFGQGFMEGLGPAGPAVKAISDGLASVYNWMSQLLGPLDATNAKWREWGQTVGGVAASGVRSVISAIQSLIGFFGAAIDKAMSLGSAIKGVFSSGGGGKGAPAGGAAPAPIAGARAMGGPVSFGKPYLVGEQGPELFVPGMSGRIEPNDTLRRLTSDGASAVASSSENTTTPGPVTIQNHWTINGADDPRAVASQIDARFSILMRQLESEQRGLLSD
ncbi:phage tail tape measure protein [Bradyrhizobium iriomotense]|nr:phage tail tape measure protein [Bradyrhizobium iriomotense]MBR1131911.1 phage tail tape measure protein [Bradyrhizobium iriomotense]